MCLFVYVDVLSFNIGNNVYVRSSIRLDINIKYLLNNIIHL